jgi:hypothetical protein
MTEFDKPAEDPHTAQEDLLCEQSATLYALRLAIDGIDLKDDTQRQGLMFLHDQIRASHERIFEMHDWLENVKDDGRGRSKAA